jgi:multidrug efflux pump subunit AcrA (membrane-fusion protein)
VETFRLSEVDPSRPLRITGSVSPWKEQDIGFEVGGVVSFVQESGTPLEGRWEEDGETRVQGQVLAALDERSYRISVATAEAAVEVAREQLGVADAMLEKVLPANLKAAIAEEKQAEAEYLRYKEAGESNAVSVIDVLRAKTSWDVGKAKVEQTRASFASKEPEKRALQASLEQAKEELENARWQLERCRRFAPFTGEVSEIYVEAGGYVQPGQPVAHLVMMDPIQVDVAVSSETLGHLRRYGKVELSVPGISKPLVGSIYELATVADPQTRTFSVSLILRNMRRSARPAGEGAPTVARQLLVPVQIEQNDPGSPWFVESRRSLRKDDQGWFVWAAELSREGIQIADAPPVAPVRKVRVVPGDRQVNYQGIYILRELKDPGTLKENTVLPLDLPADFQEGEEVVLGESPWVMQPGQIVSVLLGPDGAEPGIYVPMNVVVPDDEETGHVFVVQDGKARSVRIRLGDRAGVLVRMTAVDPAEAKLVGPGAEVIRQAHFLHDGEPVRIVGSQEVRP